MNIPKTSWILMLPLTAGLTVLTPIPRVHADSAVAPAADQKLEESKAKAGHLQDSEAMHSTLAIVVVVVLLGVIGSVYFIRKDKEEDKDLEA